jgi:hypothetical protein
MDELKSYLQKHKEALNQDEPNPALLQKILLEAQAEKKAVVLPIMCWVAAACILVLAGAGVWYLFNHTPKNSEAAVTANLNAKPATKPEPLPKQNVVEEKGSIEVEKKIPPVVKTNRTKPNSDAAINKAYLAELHTIESSFTQVINLQKQKINSTPMVAVTPDYFNDFKNQLQQMEKDEKNIKTDIRKNGINDALVDQLIKIYQQKLNVLKQLQLEMNKTNNRFKQNSSVIDSTQSYFLKL